MNVNRYDNLVLAANTYRVVGRVLKVVGTLLIVGTPVLAVIGYAQGWGRGADPWLAAWPIIATVTSVVVGVPLVIRGVVQAAHGEALVALADIAVSSSAAMHHDVATAWASRSSRASSVGAVFGFAATCIAALAVGGLCTAATISRAREQALFVPGVQVQFKTSAGIAEWSGEDETKTHFGPGAKRRAFELFEKRSVRGRPLAVARAHSGFVSLNDAPSEYVPMSALERSELGDGARDWIPITVGARVRLDDESGVPRNVWDGEQAAKAAFGPAAARKKLPSVLESLGHDKDANASDAECSVGRVAGHFFSCADSPGSYAPMSVAEVVSPPSEPGGASQDVPPTVELAPGTLIEFVVSSDDAAWGDDDAAKVAFGSTAKRRRFTKDLRRLSDGTPIEVAAVHDGYFSTKEAPAAYAPVSAARVLRSRRQVPVGDGGLP